jgi:hypothetical protein
MTQKKGNKMTSVSTIKSTLTKDSCIDGGYGEYIVYKTDSGMTKPSFLDKKTYEQCYQVLLQARQMTVQSKKQGFLKRELTQIDPTIETFFIPRTLYELCFIQKCIKETLRLGAICENIKFDRIDGPKPKCWHGAYFKGFGNDQDPIIIDLSYRLNNSIVRNLKPKMPGALYYGQITSMVDDKLAFLHSCHEISNSDISFQLLEIGDCTSSITNNMISESQRGNCKPIGIETDKMKELVLNAIALECSNVAKGKLILYRGSMIFDDKPLEYNKNGKVNLVQSLSYGTGLFAVGMHDSGAAAFHYVRKADKDAFALLVPQEEEATSPFAIPTTHPLCQMFGRGEKCHARSRAPTIEVNPKIKVGCKHGMSVGKVGSVPKHFQLAVTPQQLEERFQYYVKNCLVNLKS